MGDLSENAQHVADAAVSKIGLGALGVGIGGVNYLELAQSALVSAGSIAGSILVIWGLIDKVRSKMRKSRRSTDKRKDDA